MPPPQQAPLPSRSFPSYTPLGSLFAPALGMASLISFVKEVVPSSEASAFHEHEKKQGALYGSDHQEDAL